MLTLCILVLLQRQGQLWGDGTLLVLIQLDSESIFLMVKDKHLRNKMVSLAQLWFILSAYAYIKEIDVGISV